MTRIEAVAATAASPTELASLNPVDGSVVGHVPIHGPVEVAATVHRSRRTQLEWGRLTPRERGVHLSRVRAGLAQRAEDLAEIIAAETGKLEFEAMVEVASAVMLLSHTAARADKALAPRRVGSYPLFVKRAEIRYEPYGVVGVISPWNYPTFVPMQALSGALAAGNTVVLKPSELTPLTGRLIGEIVNSFGSPLVEVVTGGGATGAALCRAGVDKISFTGSPATARKILHAAADSLTPTVMELGGKDAMIICPDADAVAASRAAVGACFANAGRTCVAIERVVVTPENHAVVREELVMHASRIAIGSITQPGHLEVIEARLADAVAKGAQIIAGGQRRPDRGPNHFEPTVVDGVTPDMDLARYETFGPVLAIMPVADLDEAIQVANSSDFGLAGCVFGRESDVVERVLNEVSTGAMSVNDAATTVALPALPFGGVRHSGFGRLHGDAGMHEFSVTKSIATNRISWMPPLAASLAGPRTPSPARVAKAIRLLWGRSG